MSTLKVNQIRSKLLSMFEPHLNLTDLGANDSERENKVLSRCLAALAIYLQTGCGEKEAAEAVWDGGDDNGIDAVYFDPSDRRIVIVQSKFINKGSGEPEAKEIGAFAKGVRDLVDLEKDNFSSRLHKAFDEISIRLSTPGVTVHIVLVSTGTSKLAKHGSNVLEKIIGDLNGDDTEGIASSEVIGLKEVYSGLANDISANGVNLKATIYNWSFVASPYRAYFGTIDGLQLKALWKDHGKRLISQNIRHALGSTDVNNEIVNSATKRPQDFWYFNNGITVVAQTSARAPAGAAAQDAANFELEGASIVNGAQTVSSLAKVSNDSSLGVVKVPIRIILLDAAPPNFGNEVTRTNNLQNRVEQRDFVAQDPEQYRLRDEMNMEGIDYQYVRSDDVSPTPASTELIEVTTALACASADPNMAVQLKTGIGRFFADLKKAPYKTIFNPDVSGPKAFNAVLVNREIDRWIEAKKASLPKKAGAQWGALIHGNRILSAAVFEKYGVSKLSNPIENFSRNLSPANIDALCDRVYLNMVAVINTTFQGKFLAVLFKNPTMSKVVFSAAIK